MRKVMKIALISMSVLTVIYISTAIYANASSIGSSSSSKGLTAFQYESETPPTKWYMPEELGIVGIIEIGNSTHYALLVDVYDSPFDLQAEQPIFKYKDKFFIFSSHWITFGSLENANIPLRPILAGGVLLSGSWIFIGILFLKGRKKL